MVICVALPLPRVPEADGVGAGETPPQPDRARPTAARAPKAAGSSHGLLFVVTMATRSFLPSTLSPTGRLLK